MAAFVKYTILKNETFDKYYYLFNFISEMPSKQKKRKNSEQTVPAETKKKKTEHEHKPSQAAESSVEHLSPSPQNAGIRLSVQTFQDPEPSQSPNLPSRIVIGNMCMNVL